MLLQFGVVSGCRAQAGKKTPRFYQQSRNLTQRIPSEKCHLLLYGDGVAVQSGQLAEEILCPVVQHHFSSMECSFVTYRYRQIKLGM
jgi:hypothetical protein